MSYLLETLGRGLLGRLSDAFRTHLPKVDSRDERSLRRKHEDAPTSADLALQLGTLCLEQMRLREAQEAFETALRLDPDTRAAALGLACVHDELGQPEDAIRALSVAAAHDPSDPATSFAIGYCYERAHNETAAVANYRHAIELHPYLRNAHERLAALAVRRGDWDAAVESYGQLEEFEPEDLDVLLTLASLHLQRGAPEEAVELFQRALLVEPECEGALAEAAQLTQRGELSEAIGAVERLVNKFPGVPEFHVHLGDLYVKAGESGRAISEYRTALEYQPGFLEATIKLGTQQLRCGADREAAQSFARAVELNDRLITAFVGLGVAQQACAHEPEAGATFDLAASLEPNSTLLFSETTRLQLATERERRAGDSATQTAEVAAPTAQDILLEALRRHEQALYYHPNHADLHYRHGLLLRQLGETERAAEAFQAAVWINPQYTKALVKLGLCLKELGRAAEAADAFQQAMTLKTEYVDLHYQLGLLFAQRSRFDLAVEEFEQAVQGNGRNVSLRANLALALQNIGMVDRAQATWRSICDLSRDATPLRTPRITALRSSDAP